MEKQLSNPVRIAAALLLPAAFWATCASAQGHRERHPAAHERPIAHERFHTGHFVFDDRFHHNRYYPRLGYSVTALPPGRVALTFRGNRFFFHSGVWYRGAGPRFVVVRPPIGIIIPVLPIGFATVVVGSVPYYYANDVYYEQAPGGYTVVAAPPGVDEGTPQTMVEAPPAAAPPSATPSPSATWYYCESSKTYYPYVSQCKEGWHAVPATPPQTQ